jgi:hypothetical protein
MRLASVLAIALVACAQTKFGSGEGTEGGVDANYDQSFVGQDASDAGCDGLKCKWSDCSAQGKSEISFTGTVYDPAGNLPLYDVYVYVPNEQPDPIHSGDPTCSQCAAPASGEPIVGTLTDPDGKFTLTKSAKDAYGIPPGDDIPIVIQLGKWRKQLVVPHVDACTTIDLDAIFNTGVGKARQLRLPGNGSEGDMPLIAFTSGYDPAECFLRHVGIDDSEFAPPGTPAEHVHFYTGYNQDTSHQASSITGGNTPAQTYQWWSDVANLRKYDIIFNACEGDQIDRGSSAYAAMKSYLDGGGRLFTTHYYYNWFTPPFGGYQQVVDWEPAQGTLYSAHWIDTTFPNGKAYGQWLLDNGVGTGSLTNGVKVDLIDTRIDVKGSGPPTFSDSARWIYAANGVTDVAYGTEYLTFNAPMSTPVEQQCGRAVFSDVHLSGTTNGQTFPAECAGLPAGYAVNEKALEFLFFQMSSCLQDDTKPPPLPN